jgi:hypothetical protein
MLKGCAVALMLLSSGLAGTRADSDEKAAARQLLAKGSARYQSGDFAGAVADFQRAYATYPSPKILFNLGQAYRSLKKPELAAESFGRFLAASQDLQLDDRRLGQARVALKELAPEVVRVQVAVVPGTATLRLDGARDVPADFYLRRDSDPAAPHHLVASAPEYQPRNRDFTLAEVIALAAEQRKLAIEPLLSAREPVARAEPPAPVIITVPPPQTQVPPATPPPAQTTTTVPAPVLEAQPPPSHTPALVALGIGGGLAAAGAIVGAVALSKNGKLGCGSADQPCSTPEQVSAASSAHTTAIIADVLFGGAVAAGVTGGVLWFAAPTPGGSGGEVGVAGRF